MSFTRSSLSSLCIANHFTTRALSTSKKKHITIFQHEDGLTVRGCKAPTMGCVTGAIDDDGNQCSQCSSDKCNGNIYPDYRLHCLHCAGDSCVRPANSVTVRYPCATFVDTDSCYSIFSHGKFQNNCNRSKLQIFILSFFFLIVQCLYRR